MVMSSEQARDGELGRESAHFTKTYAVALQLASPVVDKCSEGLALSPLCWSTRFRLFIMRLYNAFRRFAPIRENGQRFPTAIVLLALIAWMGSVCFGMQKLLRYSYEPGAQGRAATRWPSESKLDHSHHRATLVLAAHLRPRWLRLAEVRYRREIFQFVERQELQSRGFRGNNRYVCEDAVLTRQTTKMDIALGFVVIVFKLARLDSLVAYI
jgi:hypothetical protein